MAKKRKTRKQKTRAQAKRQRAAQAIEIAQGDLGSLLSTPAGAAGADQLFRALEHAYRIADTDTWSAVAAWAAGGPWADDELANAIWQAVEKAGRDRRFSATCAAVLGLVESGRRECALRLGKQLVQDGPLAPSTIDRACAEAVDALAATTDEEWATDLLSVVSSQSAAVTPESREGGKPSTEPEEVRLQLSELFWRRAGGARAIRGFDYQNQLGLLWVVRSLDPRSGITSVSFERLEDIEIHLRDGERHPELEPFGSRVYLQAKTRDAAQGNWTIARLHEEDVLSHFVELHDVASDADLLFVSDRELGGTGAALAQLCEKLREGRRTMGHVEALDAQSPLRPSRREVAAAQEVKKRLDLDDWDDTRFDTFLSRVHFSHQGSLRHTAVVELGKVTRQSVDVAWLTWCRLYCEVFDRSQVRGVVSPERARHLVEQVTDTVAVAVGDAHDTSGLIRALDLHQQLDEDPAYLTGVRATVRHILANQDVVREDVLADISEAFEYHNLCVIRSPSGQGKSTCMYRWAAEQRECFRAWEVQRVGNPQEAEVIADLVAGEAPTPSEPILVLVDDIFGGDKPSIGLLLERLAEIPHVYILGTSREDDWRDIRPRGVALDEVRLKLDEETAGALYEMLDAEGLPMKIPWREALELSEARSGTALLMEYMHYLQQGESLEHTLRHQVARLDSAHPDLADSLHAVVRYVATMDRYGRAVSWEALGALLGDHKSDLRKCIGMLKDEHLIQEQSAGYFIGLHRLRSEVLVAICGETVPLQVTVRELLTVLPTTELVVLAERALADLSLTPDPLLERVWERLTGDEAVAEIAPRLLASVFAADQRRYARECHRRLEGLAVRTPVLSLLSSERLPDGRQAGVFDLEAMPEDARAACDALPQRPIEGTLLHRLLHQRDMEGMALRLRRLPVGDLGDALDWIAYGCAESGTRLLPLLRLGEMAERLQEADLQDIGALIAAARRVSAGAAEELYGELGGDGFVTAKLLSEDHRVLSLGQSADGIWELVWSARTEFPARLPRIALSRDDPDGIGWELGQLVLRCIPSAECVHVLPQDETGGALGFRDYEFGRKQVRRNKAYPREDVDRNVVWNRVFIEPYRADTWAGFFRHLSAARELAVELATELPALLLAAFPMQIPGSAGPDALRVPNDLINKGQRLQKLSHAVPFLPADVPSEQQTSDQDGRSTNETLPTHFDQLLRAFEFFVLGTNEADDHKAGLAPINAGMALHRQQEMAEALTAAGVSRAEDAELARRERPALSALHGVMRTCTARWFDQAKARAREARPTLRALHRVLRQVTEGTEPSDGPLEAEQDRLLTHALRTCERLQQLCRGGPKTSRLAMLLGRCQGEARARQQLLAECLALCEDLDDPSGAGLPADIVDGMELQDWQSDVEAAASETAYRDLTVQHIVATTAPYPDDTGFRAKEALLGLACASLADADEPCAELMAAVAVTARDEPARLKLVFVGDGSVLPESGRMLHVSGNADGNDAEQVQAHWCPLEPTQEEAAMLGLRLAEKPVIIGAIDLGLAHLVSGLSWTLWLNTEKRRCEPELADRVQAIGPVCEDGVAADLEALGSLEAAVAGQGGPEMQSLCADVQAWLRSCSTIVRESLSAARDGVADDELVRLLGGLLKSQPVEPTQLPVHHLKLIDDFVGLREKALLESYCA